MPLYCMQKTAVVLAKAVWTCQYIEDLWAPLEPIFNQISRASMLVISAAFSAYTSANVSF